MDNSKYVFRILTIKSAPIRTLFEALKDILTEANIEIDSSGIKILAQDGTHAMMVHLRLHADRFADFYCPTRQILGVNMINFFKLIKMMSNTESLVLYQEKSDSSTLGIDILNAEKQMVTTFKLNLIDLDIDQRPIRKDDFTVIKMPSADFQKVIRDMHTLGETVEIQSASNELIFRCKGDFAEQETVFKIGTGGMTQTNEFSDEIFQGCYNLKQLVLFTKCTPLCTEVSLCTKNNFPLVCEYAVAAYGELKLMLAPTLTQRTV